MTNNAILAAATPAVRADYAKPAPHADGWIVRLQGFYVAQTKTWEGPGRHDYMAAWADLLDFFQKGKRY